MDQLSDKIRQARIESGLSQRNLGKTLRISEMAISAYETGRAIPPLPTLKKISEITRLPFSYFVADTKHRVTLESLNNDIQKIKIDIQKILTLLTKYERK